MTVSSAVVFEDFLKTDISGTFELTKYKMYLDTNEVKGKGTQKYKWILYKVFGKLHILYANCMKIGILFIKILRFYSFTKSPLNFQI